MFIYICIWVSRILPPSPVWLTGLIKALQNIETTKFTSILSNITLSIRPCFNKVFTRHSPLHRIDQSYRSDSQKDDVIRETSLTLFGDLAQYSTPCSSSFSEQVYPPIFLLSLLFLYQIYFVSLSIIVVNSF